MSTTMESLTQPLALVASDVADRREAYRAALQQLGYAVQTAAGAPEALDRLRKEAIEVVVLDDEFQAAAGGENAVLRAFQTMPMAQRRHVFVALVGPEYKTFDNLMAFARSVNLVIGLGDLAQLPTILKRGIDDNAQFYRVFREVLQEAGKR